MQTISKRLLENSAAISSVAENMAAQGIVEIEATHNNAIELGMRNVDGFVLAIRNVRPPKKRVQKADTESEK